MTNSKNTRRALISSAFAILMCVAMLIGTTFAWFTDTAKICEFFVNDNEVTGNAITENM